jgi:hypothetical protein
MTARSDSRIKVDSWSEKQSILGVVSQTPGVHSVEDRLDIDPYAHGSDPSDGHARS